MVLACEIRHVLCPDRLAEQGLAISAPCTSMQKKAFPSHQPFKLASYGLHHIAAEDRDEENKDYDKVESVVHFQLDEAAWHGLCLQTIYINLPEAAIF